jgi:[calcium/calmodulin-dependent protein kinase] kinase
MHDIISKLLFSVSISVDLQDLLWKLLTKDPQKRITLPEVREHAWILNTTRTIPSKEENCLEEISVSEEDIQAAIKPFYTPIHILVGF